MSLYHIEEKKASNSVWSDEDLPTILLHKMKDVDEFKNETEIYKHLVYVLLTHGGNSKLPYFKSKEQCDRWIDYLGAGEHGEEIKKAIKKDYNYQQDDPIGILFRSKRIRK